MIVLIQPLGCHTLIHDSRRSSFVSLPIMASIVNIVHAIHRLFTLPQKHRDHSSLTDDHITQRYCFWSYYLSASLRYVTLRNRSKDDRTKLLLLSQCRYKQWNSNTLGSNCDCRFLQWSYNLRCILGNFFVINKTLEVGRSCFVSNASVIISVIATADL